MSASAMSCIPELLDLSSSPLVCLEHVNIVIGEKWTEDLETFWFKVLKAAKDPRAEDIVTNTNRKRGTLHWANFGLQQVHLPCQPAGHYEKMSGMETWTNKQKIRGTIGLEWPQDKFSQLVQRLEGNFNEKVEVSDFLTSIGGITVIEKTPKTVEFLSCYGNRFRISSMAECNYIGPKYPLPPSTTPSLPGERSEGLGIRYVEYFAPKNSLKGIMDTYERVLGAKIVKFDNEKKMEVLIGSESNGQFLRFVEKDNVDPYHGDHLAIYVNDFISMYQRAKNLQVGGDVISIVWNNPCFSMKYDTLEEVERLNEFRFKDFVDLETGEVVYQLEHEIRSLKHPGFLINEETFLK